MHEMIQNENVGETLFPYLTNFRGMNGWNDNDYVVADGIEPSAWKEAFLARCARRNSLPDSGYSVSLRERHPEGFLLFHPAGNSWMTREFDLHTRTIDGRGFFVFPKRVVELEWRRWVATQRTLKAMDALPIDQWRALLELIAREAGVSASPWALNVENAPQTVRRYLRAVSVTQAEQLADAVTVVVVPNSARHVA